MTTAQRLVVGAILGAWLAGVLVALVDGATVLRVTTPLMTTVLGFVFTAKATTR